MRIASFCSSAVLVSDQWLASRTWRLANTAKIEITVSSAAMNNRIRAQMRRARDALCFGGCSGGVAAADSGDGAGASGVLSAWPSIFERQSCIGLG